MAVVRWIAAMFVVPYWWIQDHLWRRSFKGDSVLTYEPMLEPVDGVDYGAESWATVEPVDDDPTLMIRTIVMLENPRRLAPLPELPAAPANALRVITGELVTVGPRHEAPATLVEDELGAWDPDAVDWSAPASIFEEIADERFPSWSALVNYDTVIAGLSETRQRESFTAFAERVLLTGV